MNFMGTRIFSIFWILAAQFVVTPSLSLASEASPSDLQHAYPDAISSIEGDDVVFKDGSRMPISDGVSSKTFFERLENPDIDDMFYAPYKAGKSTEDPKVDSDPGRIRYEPLFLKMYGDCNIPREVQKKLKDVVWVDGTVLKFTTVNGAADKLERVVSDLKPLMPRFRKYLVPSAGTFNCRAIAGTTRRSMHGYGAAIDISVEKSNYWLWVKGAKSAQEKKVDISLPYKNQIPLEIIDVFERHGFIWGGKWYHYDTMHFEYRPEFFK